MFQRNGGSFYTHEMFQEAQRAVQEEEERLLRETPTIKPEEERVGKSSAGNTILGKEEFNSELSLVPLTRSSKKAEGEVFSRRVYVVDTPGLSSSVKKEIAKCISMADPGPHVFLMVLQPNKFTNEDKRNIEIIQKLFGEEAANYTMVLFTHGDELNKKNIKIENLLETSQPLKQIISQCSVLEKFKDKYHVFDNEVEDPDQVSKLMDKINRMVEENGGSFYTNKMFEKAQRGNQEEMKRLIKENPDINIRASGRAGRDDRCVIQ
uniref:AIG1-type G domain-containing protein n=1 Tax=Poecilia latipinna TaxID=48699 RepID=A0A3B3U3T9_9TELE